MLTGLKKLDKIKAGAHRYRPKPETKDDSLEADIVSQLYLILYLNA
jgi:hypothetical protein